MGCPLQAGSSNGSVYTSLTAWSMKELYQNSPQNSIQSRKLKIPLWRFPPIQLLQKGQSMQELCHSFPICWQSWNVTKTQMLNWASRVEAVGAEVVLILCLCLTFKQLCYSSSMKGEISCSPGTVSSSHCYGWQLQITNTFFSISSPTQFCLPTSLFIFSQSKDKPKIFLQLGVPYEVSHEFSQGQEMPWEDSHSCFGCCSVCDSK